MLRVTDPATIQAYTHASARNAHEVGDDDLPTYVDPTGAKGWNSSAGPSTSAMSTAVPTYEAVQAQSHLIGGFRATLDGATEQRNSIPAYAPPGFGPAPGPGGVGGFRMPEPPSTSRPPLFPLRLPEAQAGLSSAPPSLMFPPSPLTPNGSESQQRPTSWSLNPYAAAMVRQATLSEQNPTPPGDTNPFADRWS